MRLHRRREPRPLTGRAVLICFVAFFAVVAGMNGVMIYAATSTFGGVETGSAYRAGLAFRNEIESAQRQDALNWSVRASARRDAGGAAAIEIWIVDGHGLRPSGVTANVRLAHPANAGLDRQVAMTEAAPGHFSGAVAAAAGQWTLVIDVLHAGERVFRSRNRIVLQ